MEKLLAFHLDESQLKRLKGIAAVMKIQVEVIEPQYYFTPLEDLADGKLSPLAAPFEGKVPPESLLLFCDFTEKRMDGILAALSANKFVVSYKAVLTPTNRKWNFMQLLLEMRMEQGGMSD